MLAFILIGCVILLIIVRNDPHKKHGINYKNVQTEVIEKEKYPFIIEHELRIAKMSQMFIDRYIGNGTTNNNMTAQDTKSSVDIRNGIDTKTTIADSDKVKQSRTENRSMGIKTSIQKNIDKEMKLRLDAYEQQLRALLN